MISMANPTIPVDYDPMENLLANIKHIPQGFDGL